MNHPVRYYLVTHTGRRGPAGDDGPPPPLPRAARRLPAETGEMKYYAVESTIITLTICRFIVRRTKEDCPPLALARSAGDSLNPLPLLPSFSLLCFCGPFSPSFLRSLPLSTSSLTREYVDHV